MMRFTLSTLVLLLGLLVAAVAYAGNDEGSTTDGDAIPPIESMPPAAPEPAAPATEKADAAGPDGGEASEAAQPGDDATEL